MAVKALKRVPHCTVLLSTRSIARCFSDRGHSCYIETSSLKQARMETATFSAYRKQGWWVGPGTIFLLAEEHKSQLPEKKVISFSWRKEQHQTPQKLLQTPLPREHSHSPMPWGLQKGSSSGCCPPCSSISTHTTGNQGSCLKQLHQSTHRCCTRQIASSLTSWVPEAGRPFLQAPAWNLATVKC